MEDLIALPLGFLLDQLVGDPPNWPHPVRWIGRFITILETPLRRFFPERLGGAVLLLIVTGLTGILVWVGLDLTGKLHPVCRLALSTVLIYFGLAARSLALETQAVLEACEKEDWPEARRRLTMIVGRDTQDLSPAEIYRACIETVAENTSDGVVAPLFYAALGGPVGMWIYKAINTLDSMVGYRNPRYLLFGWASARIDDVANFLPARLTFVLLAVSAFLLSRRGPQAFRIGWSDSCKHPSPNSGWPEAAMAGALGVQLGGSSTYGGIPSAKPTLGTAEELFAPVKVRQSCQVMTTTAWLALFLAAGLRLLIDYLFF